MRRGITATLIGVLVLTSACARGLPGASVPVQPGHDAESARIALQDCSATGPYGGRSAVASNYIWSFVFFGLVGVLVVAGREDDVRSKGAYRAVDKCMGDRGFERRELTQEEVVALKTRDEYARQQLLNHLIAGGTLANYDGV